MCYVPLKISSRDEVGIDNPTLNVKLRLEWDREAFPCLRYWSCNDDGKYTVALEPSTSWFSDIRDCIRHDNYISLQPMEERRFWMKISVETINMEYNEAKVIARPEQHEELGSLNNYRIQ